MPLCFKVHLKTGCTGPGDAIRASPALQCKSFDEAVINQSIERGVEGPRSQTHPRELLDVFCQGITVLWAIGQAAQDERRRTRVATELLETLRHKLNATPSDGIPSMGVEIESHR